MYERMLDKESQPDFEHFAQYCGESKDRFTRLHAFLTEALGDAEALIGLKKK